MNSPHRSASEEQALVEGLRRSDPLAIEAVLRSESHRLLAVARRMCRDTDEAQDVVQEAMIKAVTKIGSFEGRSSLFAWLKRIVVTTALMSLRAQNSRPDRAIDAHLPVFDEQNCRIEPDRGPLQDAETLMQQKQTRATVRMAINELPDSYRSVLLLRDIEGYSTDEVAALLDVSANLVKVRLHRARAALKKLLEPLMYGQGEAEL